MSDPAALVVIDTSAAINLVASGCAAAILEALPNRLLAVDTVPVELELGGPRGKSHAHQLNTLVSDQLLEFVALNEQEAKIFEGLVVGRAAETLDDGEAATIAYAVANGATALIDERKASRICSERFPHLSLGCTADLFAHRDVLRALGRERLRDAVLNALRSARMRVLPRHFEWVVGLIGQEQASTCTSLPRSVRYPLANPARRSS